MERGELVGDDLIIGIVRERLSRPDAMAGFVLDGFPRTATQADALDEITAARGPVICVEIQVPDEELVRRVRGRRVCDDCGANADAFEHKPDALPDLCQNTERCRTIGPKWVARSDDSEAVVRERLKIYWRDTRPMIEYYSARPTFRAIDGLQSPEQVREALVSAVASALGLPASQLQSLVGEAEAAGGAARHGRGVIVCRSAAEIEKLARVNALVARVLKELAAAVKPGVTTAQLDELAEQRLREAGAEPAFKGYHGYPATICASVNEQVVHGIPIDARRWSKATSSRSTWARSSTGFSAIRR